MSDDIDNMSGPELADAVAREVMGWIEGNEIDHRNRRWWIDGDGDSIRAIGCWSPQSGRGDAYLVLKRCEELGPDIVWKVWAVIRKYSGQPQHHDPYPWEWRLLTIDPAIVCRAALRAVREARK